MDVKLYYSEDVKPEYRDDRSLRFIRFHHLTTKAQKVLRIAGRGVLWRHDIYEAVYPPGVIEPKSKRKLVIAGSILLTIAGAAGWFIALRWLTCNT